VRSPDRSCAIFKLLFLFLSTTWNTEHRWHNYVTAKRFVEGSRGRTPASRMWRRVARLRTNISEQLIVSIIGRHELAR
jgi:hypothetical protein